MKRTQTYLFLLPLLTFFLLFNSGCKKRIFYPHVENDILPLAIGNEWNYRDSSVFSFEGSPVDTVVRDWSLRVTDKTEFKTSFRKWIELYIVEFEGDANCTSKLYLYSKEDGLIIWTAEKETSTGSSLFEPINVNGPYWVKHPTSVGESWALDNGEENSFEFRCGLPVSSWIDPSNGSFPPMGPYFLDSETWTCLSTDTLVSTPAGDFSSYNFSGEFWSAGVGKVGASLTFWDGGTETNPEYQLLLKSELVDYQIN